MQNQKPIFPSHTMSPRTLLGPGPSMVHPRVLAAMSAPLIGHLDPEFLTLMDRLQELLRYTFETRNRLTVPVSGTGSAAMEADSKQSEFCMWLSAIVLAGLVLNAAFGMWWADSAAALAMVPIITKEGVEGLRAKACRCR